MRGRAATRLFALLLLPAHHCARGEVQDVASKLGLRSGSAASLRRLTEQQQSLECSFAFDACECADKSGCRWLTYSGGAGGECRQGGGGVSCSACDTQAACPGAVCSNKTSACDCVANEGDITCHWDQQTGSCVVPTADPTFKQRCQACASLGGCNFPQTVSLDPVNGGSTFGRTVMVFFSADLQWCSSSASTGAVGLWCGDSASGETVSTSKVDLEGYKLTVDVSDALLSLDPIPSGGRRCGLAIEANRLCNNDDFEFLGLAATSYSFIVYDDTRPSISSYSPSPDLTNVPMNGWASITFSEPIVETSVASVGSGAVGMTLGKLRMDWSGSSTGQIEQEIAAAASIVQEVKLRIALEGIVEADRWYTLQIPSGAVADTAGNEFEGLPFNEYKFRVGSASVGGIMTNEDVAVVEDAGPPVLLIASIVMIVMSLSVLGAIWVTMRLKGHANMSQVHNQTEPAPVKVPRSGFATDPGQNTSASLGPGSAPLGPGPATGPPPSVAWQHPGSDDATMWARPADRQAAIDAALRGERLRSQGPPRAAERRPSDGAAVRSPREEHTYRPSKEPPAAAAAGSTPGQAQQQQQRQQQQQPPRQPAGAGPRISEPPRAQARQARRDGGEASGGAGPGQGGQQPEGGTSEAQATCPQAKAVESKLRGMMDAPIEERKKAYKALLLEYHPDKNSEPFAKEVFQYINGAKDWFLHAPS